MIEIMKNTPVELWCPIDRLLLSHNRDSLVCASGHSYPVQSEIPRFTNEAYSSAFGYQWKIFAKTQFDSYTKTSITKNRVIEACGEEVWSLMSSSMVLEVGCGAGRFTEILLNSGAMVYSVDLSLAVDVNKENFPLNSKHRVIQADVAHLPFKAETFPIVFCLGVIQHTPNPEETIKYLSSFVAPGGWLIIDHYGKSMSWYLRSAPLARIFLKRMPPEKALTVITFLYTAVSPLYRKSSNRIYRKVLHVVFPLVYFDREIPELPDKFKDEWSILDTFDSLTDWHKHRRSVAQVKNQLNSLGLSDVTCFAGGNGVVARARKKHLPDL